VEAGDALVDGYPRPKSDKVSAGSWLEVTLPAPVTAPVVVAEPVTGLKIVYDDDDIVVVDKPVGVAAHPSPGWTGPTVIGGLAAMGQRVATSGAAERQGVVHRLDVGTTGLMVVAKSEMAYSALETGVQGARGRQEVPRRGAGAPGPAARHDRRADRPAPDRRLPLCGDERRQAQRDPLRHAGGVPVGQPDRREAGDRADAPDPGALSALRHPCVGDLTYGADPTQSARLGLHRQWLHARELAFVHPRTQDEVRFVSDYPGDLEHALDVLRDGN